MLLCCTILIPPSNGNLLIILMKPPFYFHCTEVVWWNMSLFNNRPSVVLLIINFYSCRVTTKFTIIIIKSSVDFCNIESVIIYSLQKDWIQSEDDMLKLFAPICSLLRQNNALQLVFYPAFSRNVSFDICFLLSHIIFFVFINFLTLLNWFIFHLHPPFILPFTIVWLIFFHHPFSFLFSFFPFPFSLFLVNPRQAFGQHRPLFGNDHPSMPDLQWHLVSITLIAPWNAVYLRHYFLYTHPTTKPTSFPASLIFPPPRARDETLGTRLQPNLNLPAVYFERSAAGL